MRPSASAWSLDTCSDRLASITDCCWLDGNSSASESDANVKPWFMYRRRRVESWKSLRRDQPSKDPIPSDRSSTSSIKSSRLKIRWNLWNHMKFISSQTHPPNIPGSSHQILTKPYCRSSPVELSPLHLSRGFRPAGTGRAPCHAVQHCELPQKQSCGLGMGTQQKRATKTRKVGISPAQNMIQKWCKKI